MRILNYGSLNIDQVYQVEHFVSAGETILAKEYKRFLGGKGLNQSIALARSGRTVFHMGAIGPDGEDFLDLLKESNVNTRYLKRTDTMCGHAIIQVNAQGQNSIIVSKGANGSMLIDDIDFVLSDFGESDLLLIQNEVSNVPHAIRSAKSQGMQVAFNASPITDDICTYPISLVDYLIINEVEGKSLLKTTATSEEEILLGLCKQYPSTRVILTVGEKGSYFAQNGCLLHQQAYPTNNVVDTTGAGDTFCGYFIASIAEGKDISTALHIASLASSLAIRAKGAAQSIPTMKQVSEFSSKEGF